MESAGERLKKVRLSKGIKLEDVHKKTRIHMNILQALEGDGVTDLNPIYLKGFLKLYCHYLGVDPKNYIPDYQEPQGIIPSTRMEEPQGFHEPVPPAPKLEQEEVFYPPPLKTLQQKPASAAASADDNKTKPADGPRVNIIPALVTIVLTALLSLALFNAGKWVFTKAKAVTTKSRAKAGKSSSVMPIAIKKEELRQTSVQKPKSEPSAGRQSVPYSSGIRLVIKARENCWISLKTDGRLVFQRVLEKGRFGGWKAKDKIELSVGNAGAVELEVNGKLFGNIGRRGQARKNIIITREGINID